MDIYTRLLICLAAIVVLAAPSCAAPTPFVIGGWIFYENGTDCDDPAVNITNTDTGMKWQAVTAAGSNYYQIVRVNGTDLNESEQLQFSAKSSGGSQSNGVDRAVAHSEVDAGGIFDFNITLTSSSGEIDLIVDSITPNCDGHLFGNESNNISAVIKNIGNASAPTSNARFVSGSHTEVVSVPALDPDNDTTVSITDPTIRVAGAAVTITVTADCGGEVAESNETNNATILDVTVVNNGYKGKTYTGGSNITTQKSYNLHGNLIYSVGDSYYLSSSSDPNWTTYNASWTESDLPVAGAVVEARLYTTYTWDKDGVMPGDVSMSFNGVDQVPEDAHYWDDRVFPDSKPYGMLVYNVTGDFITSGNVANLTNSHTGGNNVSMRGMMLLVVCENASEPQRLIYVNEEFDLLYGGSSKCTTPDEATAWAPITGSIDTTMVANATLITVAPGAGPNEGELIFNGQVWNDVWNFAGTNGTQIGIDERDVKSDLKSTDNLVGFRSSGDWMEASNVFLVVELGAEPSAEPDLTVETITPNCDGYLFGNESNNISAVIKNIGNASAPTSNARFVSGSHTEVVSVPALDPDNDTTVSITDPTIRVAGAAVTITVTADCGGEVAESNETNNATILDVTVVNNGYKGKTYTGGSNITTQKSYNLHGNLIYSVGDSYYLSSSSDPNWTTYNASWTESDLPVAGAVVEARLYTTYTWDKDGVMPGDVSMSFNGVDQVPEDAHYWDDRVFPDSKPYGMLVYNVTGDFITSGNVANLTNSHTGGNNVSMRGMMLLVVCENASEPQRLIYVNEEFDLLYGGSSKCTTPDEATAWAPITGSIDTTMVANATLITVAPGAGPNEGELIFNGQVWNDVWNFAGTNGTQIGIDERDVKSDLKSTDNLVGFRSSGDWMEASNIFLVVELMPKLDHINVTSPTSLTLNITESVNFTATGFDQNNTEISGLVFDWAISDAYIGSLTDINDTATNFTAEHVGITYLTASNRSVNRSVTSDPVRVTVNAPTVTENVTNGTGTATSGSSTAIVTLSNESVNGTITIKGLDDPINSTTANGSAAGLGTGVELIKGVNITASADVTGALANDTNRTSWIHIKIEYNESRLGDIDENTLFIYKYVNGSGWVKLVSGSNNCTANGRNTTANYIWANVTHLCDFGAGGSTLAENGGNTGGSTGGGGGGGSGTYPPGWFGTPTPTVTATKAPTATPTTTAAPPGERVTPAPTKRPDAAEMTTTPAAEGTTAETAKKGVPGFTSVFAIAGMLAVAYAMMRRRE